MKVEEIMSRPVVTVAPSSPLKDVATLLTERQISGVPVVEAGRVVGVVCRSTRSGWSRSRMGAAPAT